MYGFTRIACFSVKYIGWGPALFGWKRPVVGQNMKDATDCACPPIYAVWQPEALAGPLTVLPPGRTWRCCQATRFCFFPSALLFPVSIVLWQDVDFLALCNESCKQLAANETARSWSCDDRRIVCRQFAVFSLTSFRVWRCCFDKKLMLAANRRFQPDQLSR